MLLAYEFYNIAQSLASLTPAQQFRDDLQNLINEQFEIASDYYVIQKKTRNTNTFTNIGVRLTSPYSLKEQSTMRDDFRNIIFKNNASTPLLGDIFKFNNYYYMCIDITAAESVTVSCTVQRCNVILKFTESTPLSSNVMTLYGISSRYYIDGLKKNQFITLPDNDIEVYIPNDTNGRKIVYTHKGGTRFLIGNPYQNWQVTTFDNISKRRPMVNGNSYDDNGIIMLQLSLSEINSGYDDLVNGVAWQDYF